MANNDFMLGGGTGGYLSATDPNKNGMYEDDSNYLYDQIQPKFVANRGGVMAPFAAGLGVAAYGLDLNNPDGFLNTNVVPSMVTASDYLDDSFSSVSNFFRPNRNQYVGPMGNPHDMTGGAGSYDANMPGTMMVADNYIPPKPVGWTPYQEVDTGLRDEFDTNAAIKEHYDRVREDNSKTQYIPREGGYSEAITEDAQNSLPYMTGVLAREADRFDREANSSFTAGFNQGWSDIKKNLSTGKPQTSAWQEWKDSFARGMKAK